MNFAEFKKGINLLIANYRQSYEKLAIEELQELFMKRFTGEQWLNIVRQIKRVRVDFLPTEACFHEAATKLGYYKRSQFELDQEDKKTGRDKIIKLDRKKDAKFMIKDLEEKGFNKLAKKIRTEENL